MILCHLLHGFQCIQTCGESIDGTHIPPLSFFLPLLYFIAWNYGELL